MNQYPVLDVTEFSTPDLETLIAIFKKYVPDAAQLAESGELRLGAGAVGAAGSRQR